MVDPVHPDDDEPDDDLDRPVPRHHLAFVLLAVALGTGAMVWISAGVANVYFSRPSNPDGQLFSILGATLQAVVATAGAFALMALAVILGDRATGGTGPWWRRDYALAAAGCMAGWIVLSLTTP